MSFADNFLSCLLQAPLAHAWLEQRTHNPLVPCSTHGGGTRYENSHSKVAIFLSITPNQYQPNISAILNNA